MRPGLRFRILSPLILVVAATSSWASVTIRFTPPPNAVAVGQSFQVQLRADMPTPVLGWGLDVSESGAEVARIGLPLIGPSWSAGYAPDGDGLVGLAFPATGGSDVLLATLTYEALSLGDTILTAGMTPGDLTEGFPLDPAGFDTVVFEPAHITIIPEPMSLVLVIAGLGWGGRQVRSAVRAKA